MLNLQQILKNKKGFNLKNKNAYSLAEVMVSASLLTVVLLMFLAISQAGASLGRLGNKNKALGIARATAEQIRLTNDNSSAFISYNNTNYPINVEQPSTVSPNGQTFTVKIKPTSVLNIITTPVTVTWRNPDGTTRSATATSSLKRRRI